jgi:N-methylhydantoinase B/oxoprolinase/acetone carboxylase alpha subunit
MRKSSPISALQQVCSDLSVKSKPDNPVEQMIKENGKAVMMNSISSKLEAGKELTDKEMDYLRDNDPEKYKIAKQIKSEREIYKNRLKNCKSKNEARGLHLRYTQMAAEGSKAAKSPSQVSAAKWRYMSIQDTYNSFTRSSDYGKLP